MWSDLGYLRQDTKYQTQADVCNDDEEYEIRSSIIIIQAKKRIQVQYERKRKALTALDNRAARYSTLGQSLGTAFQLQTRLSDSRP